jgi:hypothetical protein
LGSKQLRYTLDDRETDIVLTATLGGPKVVMAVEPPYREGSTPGCKVSFLFSHDQLEAVRQYLTVAVRAAMVRDDVPDRKQVEVPFFFGPGQLVLCLSPNDVTNLAGHMNAISRWAKNLSIAGSWVEAK